MYSESTATRDVESKLSDHARVSPLNRNAPAVSPASNSRREGLVIYFLLLTRLQPEATSTTLSNHYHHRVGQRPILLHECSVPSFVFCARYTSPIPPAPSFE